jgi:hypothetical protein
VRLKAGAVDRLARPWCSAFWSGAAMSGLVLQGMSLSLRFATTFSAALNSVPAFITATKTQSVGMPQHYVHEMVNHAAVEYGRGNVHTNGIENFWSLLKRGIGGTYVAVEPFHLFRYVDEQAFRYNNRKHRNGDVVSDSERFSRLCSRIVGRRLTYKELTGKEGETEAFLGGS